MPLCPPCQGFSIHSFADDPDGIRALSLESVQGGAGSGCDFCGLLLTALKDDIAYTPYSRARTWVRMRFSADGNAGGLGLSYNKLHVKLAASNFAKPRQAVEDGGQEHELCAAADPKRCKSERRHHGQISGRRSYVRLTRLRHQACNQTNSGTVYLNPRASPLPTRCIDVQNGDLTLRETEGDHGTYATLSHRWNEETEKCKTTMQNLHERRRRLDLKLLSKTFQHALHVIRQLGIRYVWIDSICIIQSGDNGKDWSKEALKMGQYYQHSLFTIAATTSSALDGFLSVRPQRPFTALVRLPYRTRDGVPRGVFYIYKRIGSVDDEFLASVWNSELLKRGWVFQEWLLSRRVAYFTPTQIFFECQAKRPKSECEDVIKLPNLPPGLGKGFTLKNELHIVGGSIDDTWYRILEIYSRLHFTITDKDRIIALSGVAGEVRDTYMLRDAHNKERGLLYYTSGLWLRDIHHGLLWEQKRAPDEYTRIGRFPTWSWASFQHEVKWPKRRRRTEEAFEVLGLTSSEGTCYPLDYDPGQLPAVSAFSSSPAPLLGIELEQMTVESNFHTDERHTLSDPFDVDDTFTTIHIRARIHSLLRQGSFKSKADIRLAAWATGVEIAESELVPWIGGLQAGEIDIAVWESAIGLDSRSKPWQVISSTRDPTIIVGWGSFEKFCKPNDNAIVAALHVSIEKCVPGGLAFGSLGSSHDVLNVLFVERVEVNKFRRVGVGKIFDQNVVSDFAKTALQDIELT